MSDFDTKVVTIGQKARPPKVTRNQSDVNGELCYVVSSGGLALTPFRSGTLIWDNLYGPGN